MSDEETRDDAKKKILARRASFIAAALASVACQKEPAEKPQPCLSVPVDYNPDAAPVSIPACLSPPVTAGPIDAGPPPAPCLTARPMPPRPPAADAGRPVPPPQPMPCLTPMRPEDVKK